MDDLISRQQAIDALDVLCQEHRYKIPGKRETYSQYNEAWQDALDRAEGSIFNLPPAQPDLSDYSDKLWRNAYERGKAEAQPESLTDKEQRIFLAAMEREEKVCKQVDEECRDCREPYDDSLVRTCHEIKRKVKGALWT